MAIEEAVDQVQIARPAAPGADRELASQMRLGTRRESGHLLVPDMHPVDLAVAANRVGQPIEAVADNAVDSFDTNCRENFCELISDGFAIYCPLLSGSGMLPWSYFSGAIRE